MLLRSFRHRHRNWWHFAHDASGAAAIEMAVVTPLFLVFTLGILGYGIYFGAAHSIQQLAADAARSSVAGLDTNERVAISERYVANNAASYPFLRPEKLKVSAAPSTVDANDFVVRLTYDAHDLPIWGFAPIVALPSQTIERVAVVRRGGAL